MVKAKKTDKDKYFYLAKQQGYRARSAFKLIQLNKKYDFLSTSRVCIDLCAAPGGWCQVAAKYMPAMSTIIGIDLLPIRPIRGVKTFQCDITSQKCRQIIRGECPKGKVDVVLNDGAPNMGSEYTKDAFIQNELVLQSARLATDVLGPGGCFVSKVFRSQDYNSLMWVLKQLFKKVSATKPLSSRNESAEIFVVCEGYLAPDTIDPKLLDGKYVFEQLRSEKKNDIFHPKYGTQRNRSGYDESLPMGMFTTATATEFIDSKDPIRMLTDVNAIIFGEGCGKLEAADATTDEIKECLSDLRVIGRVDFKHVLKWRLKMIEAGDVAAAAAKPAGKGPKPSLTADQQRTIDEQVEGEEMDSLRARAAAKKKKEKRKAAKEKAKLQQRIALGMNASAIEPDLQGVFSLKRMKANASALEAVRTGEMTPGAAVHVGQSHEFDDEDWEDAFGQDANYGQDSDDSDDEDFEAELDKQMDGLYDQYQDRLGSRSSSAARLAKRSKVAKLAIAGELVQKASEKHDADMNTYLDQLSQQGKRKGQEEDSDTDGDMSEDEAEKPNSLIDDLGSNKALASTRSSRWFSSHPLLSEAADDEENVMVQDAIGENSDSEEEQAGDYGGQDDESDSDEGVGEGVYSSMPKTDKQARHEKRLKVMARNERKKSRVKREDDEEATERDKKFEIVSTSFDAANQSSDEEEGDGAPAAKKAKKDASIPETEMSKKAKEMIRAGVGTGTDASGDIEVVKGGYEFPEHYDADDISRTLAIGHMMLRKAKRREIIDASYNRFAFNDEESSLPSWFKDDEERHLKPQIQVSETLQQQMLEKFQNLADAPIKKVAEARARKRKRLANKVAAAKKKAEAVSNAPDMSMADKQKAIDKMMKGAKLEKPSKVYVVSAKNGAKRKADKNAATGTVKMVDKRMKADNHNEKRRAKGTGKQASGKRKSSHKKR